MANKKGVLGRPFPDASVPRNAFDRSFNRSVHYSVGMAIPSSGAVPVIAGSHSKLNRKIFQRTQDVYTAAFTPLDTHMQFYFVPMRQLMTEWDDFKLNISDHNSSFFHAAPSGGGSPTPGQSVPVPGSKVPWCMMSEIKECIRLNASSLDSAGYPFEQGALRLLNLMGYGNFLSYEEITDDVEVNLLRLCAYQKVYFDHFRNTAYESNDPLFYNMDYYRNANYHVSDTSVLKGLLTLRYVNYRKDYFQNLYPALTYVSSTPAGNNWLIPSWVQGTSYNRSDLVPLVGYTGTDKGRWVRNSDGTMVPQTYEFGNNSGNLYLNGTGNPGGDAGNFSIKGDSQIQHSHSLEGTTRGINPSEIISVMSPQTIRAEFALDKLLRSSAYAPKHAKDQYEARYGIKFKYNPNESIFIGSFMNDIVINEVTNMAQTATSDSGANLGDIGGKGIGSSDYGNTLDFNNLEDGFIIPILYTIPRTCYSSARMDRYNTKVDRNAFFIPEFMDSGLRPLTLREMVAAPVGTDPNTILGYQPPYQEYKIGIDENMGLFGRPFTDSQFTKFVINSNQNIVDSLGVGGLTYGFFKVKPYDVRNIFRVGYDGTYQTDQLITYLRTSIVVNQNMSVHGQPRLGS